MSKHWEKFCLPLLICFKACSFVDESKTGRDLTHLFADGLIILYSNKNAKWQHHSQNTSFERQQQAQVFWFVLLATYSKSKEYLFSEGRKQHSREWMVGSTFLNGGSYYILPTTIILTSVTSTKNAAIWQKCTYQWWP